MVGALLVEPVDPTCATGVIYFNNVDYLGMCGHGLIGVVRTLQFQGRITPGTVHLDTPVGPVSAVLAEDGEVTIRNVPSYCHRSDVSVEVPGLEGRLAHGLEDGPGVKGLDVYGDHGRREEVLLLHASPFHAGWASGGSPPLAPPAF